MLKAKRSVSIGGVGSCHSAAPVDEGEDGGNVLSTAQRWSIRLPVPHLVDDGARYLRRPLVCGFLCVSDGVDQLFHAHENLRIAVRR
jgi:hypothetical protein